VRLALADLGLGAIAVVYPGNKRFRFNEQIEAVPLNVLNREGLFTERSSSV
jgi:c-di-GMP-binding flagellar brake protein YcgR